MTEREYEILNLIINNPMITQNEIADILGITRSGVAAHIFNLTKKGYIEGRGYILKESNFVTVIGGINIDILGISAETIITNNSNPGKISFALGGAGRNIALGLTKLEISNYFISVYGDDLNGDKFIIDAKDNGMDIQYCKQLKDEHTSTYLYIDDPKGNRILGIDDMDIYNKISPDLLKDKLEKINNSRFCVIDTNLPKDTIEWLYDNCKVPIIVKTVSENKNYKLLKKIEKINTLIIPPNELKGIVQAYTDEVLSLDEGLSFLIKKGVENIIVFSNEDGIKFRNKDISFVINNQTFNTVNTNGASASLTSGLIWALINQKTWKDSVEFAYAAAVSSAETENPINRDLSVEFLQEKRKDLFK